MSDSKSISGPKHYKTLISGTLVQCTAFSTGGCDPHGRVDSPVARNGQDRLTLRGSGLAGAFIAGASRQFGDKLPLGITAGSPGAQAEQRHAALEKDPGAGLLRLSESVWRFHTSHPLEDPPVADLEVRSGVGIRHDTGAAAEGLKYEVETVPAGAHWSFLLEIDEYRDQSELALPIALHVLDAWRDVCVLGRNVARGLGWMYLDPKELRVLRLEPEDADLWPNAMSKPKDALEQLPKEREQDAKQLGEIKQKHKPTGQPPFCGTGRIEIGAGRDEDTWGLDSLSLGGSDAIQPLQDLALAERHPGKWDPDLVLAWTRRGKQPPRPFIPGSGLRGPLRHALSWWRRSRHGESVYDPNHPDDRKALAGKAKEELDPIENLFGSGTYAGALLLSDAELEDPAAFTDDALLYLEQHAEDEFTGGTYAEAKFNRLALARGTFRFHYLIEADSTTQMRQFRDLLAQLQALGEMRQIPIGGAKWRGHGWVRWHFDLPPEQAQASTKGENP